MKKRNDTQTIYWTALVSVTLTLTLVAYFTNFLRDYDDNELYHLFKTFLVTLLVVLIPATIIYRLLFGKIYDPNWNISGVFSLFLGGYLFISIDNYFILSSSFENRAMRLIVAAVIAIIITKIIYNFCFTSGGKEDK